MAKKSAVVELLRKHGGALKLRPEYVQRFYPDLNRLGQKKLKRHSRQFIPERWIGSSVEAINPPPIPSGGLSMIDVGGEPLSLRDAVKAAPEEMLGDELLKAHGPEFRVLVKVLDPGEPIPFHLHATDAQVKRLPRNFRGHRFGKDEAYYFLQGPKGPMPYTHAGLYPGVSRRELMEAVKKGPEYALELSPVLYQEYEVGFFVPAGVPHRPGTALTLEIQQPSDVYTLLEMHAGGKPLPPAQIYPGFKSLDEAFKLIDFDASQAVYLEEKHWLSPELTEESARGGEVAWVFPLEVCRKFGGKRLRVKGRLTYREDRPVVLWVWRGWGKLNGRRVRAGEEFFIARNAAASGLELENDGEELLEAFAFFSGTMGA